MSNKLFSDFEPTSAKAFKQQIQYDLRGADYNETVIWRSPEGIDVKPFYHRDDIREIATIPGQPESWQIAEEIFILDPQVSAQTANEVLSRGVDALFFKADKPFNIQELLNGIKNPAIPLYLDFDFLNVDFYETLKNILQNERRTVFLNLDIIGNLARTGNWFTGMDQDFEDVKKIIGQNPSNNFFSIDAILYQNAGATIVQQLAYALSHANEYLNYFGEKLQNSPLTFQVAVGGNYFFEIAKIRALRLIYSSIAAAYNLPQHCHITVTPSRRNKVIYDYNTNMLRTTTETMSAILGGADVILNQPYDALYHKTNEFGQRIARNQLLILKEESYFDKVADPAEGTYYIESLTQQLAEKSLKLFKDLEAGGGFLKHLKAGVIQQKIKDSAGKEQDLFDEGKMKLLGTNKHPNPDDRMQHELELYPFVKTKPRKTLLEPIIPKRLAEEMEKERLENENSSSLLNDT